jgi:hypothetical protein
MAGDIEKMTILQLKPAQALLIRISLGLKRSQYAYQQSN